MIRFLFCLCFLSCSSPVESTPVGSAIAVADSAGVSYGAPYRIVFSSADASMLGGMDLYEVDEIRGSADSLRCYLLHKNSEQPVDWVQPSIDEYDASIDPCGLLPGFRDPNSAERQEMRRRISERRLELMARK